MMDGQFSFKGDHDLKVGTNEDIQHFFIEQFHWLQEKSPPIESKSIDEFEHYF